MSNERRVEGEMSREEDRWVPVRSEEPRLTLEPVDPPKMAKSAVEVLGAQLAAVEAGLAAVVERLERLEGDHQGDSSVELQERRTALVGEAPFRAATYDRDTIVTHSGRRICAVFTLEDRAVLIQALNDAADASRRRQR